MSQLAAAPTQASTQGPIGEAIAFVIGDYMTSFFVVGLIVGAIQILRLEQKRDGAAVSGILLNTFILYGIGCAEAVNFVMHSVFGDFAARSIGWAQSPFQLELAFRSLGVAVMAFILYGKNSAFRGKVAIVIATVIFGFGAAGGHVYQMVVNNDYSVNNTGLLLVSDIAINAIGLAFLIWHAIARRHGTVQLTDAAELDRVVDSVSVGAAR